MISISICLLIVAYCFKMGKWAKYNKNFQQSWLSESAFKNWLQEVKNDNTKAFCKVCKTELRAQKNDLTQHSKTNKHIKNMSTVTSNQTTVFKLFTKKETVSRFEIFISIYIACHTAIRNVDHLTDILKAHMPGSSSLTNKMKLHRTKCTALICNVISPEIFKGIVQDLKDMPFSLLIDESTDVSCTKHLCLCVRYYSRKLNIICTISLA